MYNGIINVYKEKGFTSHDVVAKLRGILHQKKIGHTGTLDPDAQGVLPVCLGSGTKLCDMLTEKDKTYEAVMLLGVMTDTQDTSGTIIARNEVAVTSEEVVAAISSFIGEYQQVPPMYSALKVNGKKLYELAREGITVERKARTVTIYDIQIREIDLPRVRFEVKCSKGTYIRTLCEDIGKRLGCGACMEELVRTRVSCFQLSDSLRLSQIERLVQEERLEDYVIGIEAIFHDREAVFVKEEWNRLLYNGNPFCERNVEKMPQISDGREYRVYTSNNTFIGIYQYKKEKNIFSPVKIFYRGEE